MITRRHLLWPGILIALIGSLVIVDVTMIVVSSSDTAIRIERPGDDTAPRIGEPGRLSVERWRMAVQLGAPDTTSVPIVVKLTDLDGTQVNDASVQVQAAPANANGAILTAEAVRTSPGVFVARLPVAQPAMWDVLVRADDGIGAQSMNIRRMVRPAAKEIVWP